MPGSSSSVTAAQMRSADAAAMSKIERTSVLEMTVVYVESLIARWASTTRTASPARTGMIALIPMPERYAA